MPTLYAHDPAKRKKIKVGEVIGTAVIIEKNSKKHFMRVVDGYGIQKEAITLLDEAGVKEVRIHETDTGLYWKSDLSDWRLFGRLADYGNGKQWFLSMKYMKQYKPKTETIK